MIKDRKAPMRLRGIDWQAGVLATREICTSSASSIDGALEVLAILRQRRSMKNKKVVMLVRRIRR